MLRDKSQELPSSLTPQWLLNRGAGAAAAGTDGAAGHKQQASASPAAGREGKWVPDRWGPTEKDEKETKWGHEPFDRPARWAAEADGDERGLGGGRMPRDTGRWKPGGEREWGGAAHERPSVFPPADRDRAVDRWDRGDRAERVELPPARDSPAQRGRWRADDKPQEKWGRGDTPTWRALPGEGGAPGPFRPVGRGAGMGEREPDRYGERPDRGLGGVGIPRDEGGFGASRLADDRLMPGKGRGFGGYGRGRPAGGLGVPGAYAGERSEWGRDAEPVLGRTQSGLIGEGRTSRGRHKPKAYTIEHLEDLLEVMTIKCGKEGKELPLPRGITLEELGEIWKGYVYEESSFDSYHATAARSSMDLPPARTSTEAPSAAAAAAPAARRSFEGASAAAADAAPAGGPAPAAAAAPAQAVAAPAAVAAAPPAAAAAVQLPAAVAAQQQLLALLPPGMVIQALEHDQWFYKDPNGNQQGPFSRHDILDWTEQGFFPVDTLPICSALPGQESVWTTLHTMIHVWAQMAGAQIRLPEPPQVAEPPHVPLQPDMNLGVMGHDQSRTRVEQWLQQQPDEQQQQQQQQQQPVQQQQQAHLGLPYGAPGGMPAHTAAPGPFGSTFLAPGSGPMGGPGGPGWDAGPASAGFPQQPLFPPPAQSFAPGGPVAGPTAAGPGPHMGQAGPGPLGHGFGPAAGQPQQQQPQQRTLFGTPLEPTPPAVPEPVVPAAVAPAPAAAAAAGAAPLTSTGSKMLDLLFKRGVHAQAQQQQQQQQAPAVQAPAAAAPEPPAAAARPAQDTGSWETVPTKATKQQERAAAQHQRQQQQEQQQWQQPQQRQPPAQLQHEEEESVSAPSGPVQVPLFPQQQKPEPPKVAPWAAAAPAAAPTHTKSLREIQEEEQAQAAAEEAARAEAAAAAAAAAANAAAAPAGPGAPWGGARPGSASSGAPPGWGPPPAAAVAQPLAAGLGRAGSSGNNVAAAAAAQPTGPVGADDQPAQLKKAMLGEVLRARLGNVGRTDSNASGNSAGQAAAAAGPWGAVAAQRQAVPFTHIMQQETEETLADMEGGGAQEENLDDIIAALSRHNNSNNRQQQQQRQHSGAAANDDGLFWDYTGAAGSNAAPAAAPEPPVVQQPQQQQQTVWAQPPAAVAAMQAAAAASRATGAPSAAAPPPVAGPWARVSKHNVIKTPPPGSVPPPAAAPAARPPQPAAARAAPAARPAAAAAAAPAATAASRPAAAAGGGSNGAAAAVDGGLFMGGLDISAAFASWCRSQMLALNGNEDLTMIEFLWGLDSNSEIAEYCQMVWGNKPGVSSFVAEFVKRKLAEKNRKPGGKKKKGAAAAAAAAAAVPQSSGVSAAAVGLVSAGPVSDLWSKIPKKPGGKKKKGTKMDPGALGFTTANNLSVLQEDDDE